MKEGAPGVSLTDGKPITRQFSIRSETGSALEKQDGNHPLIMFATSDQWPGYNWPFSFGNVIQN